MSDTSEAASSSEEEFVSTANQPLTNSCVLIGRMFGWGSILLSFLAIFGFLADYINLPTTFTIFGLAIAYVGKYLYIARSPDIVRAFQLDRYIGSKNSGWYFGIPFFLSFGIVSRNWTVVDFADTNVPLKSSGGDEPNEYCSAKGMIQIRPGADPESLEKSLAMTIKDMVNQAAGIAVSELHTVCGKMTLDQSVKQFKKVSDKVRDPMMEACKDFGYDRQGFRLDIDYPTLELRADGAARGYAAERLSKPLADNYPAALTASVQTIMDGIPAILGKKPKPSKDVSSGQGDLVLSQDMLEEIAAKLGVGKES